jgi:hypothetical protein
MIHLGDNDESRCRAAWDFLQEHRAVSIGDYTIRLTDEGVVEVGVPTQWDMMSNQTKESQEQEIEEARQFMLRTIPSLPILGSKLDGKKYSFLMISDWGKGAVALAEPTPPE